MKKYKVTITTSEQESLRNLISSGKYKNTKLRREQILIGSDESQGGMQMKDLELAHTNDISIRTIDYTRQRFVEDGLDIALNGKPRLVNVPIKIDSALETHLVSCYRL